MKLNWLSERICFLPYEEAADRPDLYYIKGDKYAIAVDAGNSAAHVRKFYDALTESKLPLPKLTVISHWHWDHTFGLHALHGLSMGSSYTQNKLQEVSEWKWDRVSMKERERSGEDIPFCNEHILIEYPDLNDIQVKGCDITIDDDVCLEPGGLEVQVLPRASTHTLGALYVYVPAEKVLIVQDGDCEDFYHGGSYDQQRLRQMIAFFANTDYEYHCLGHADFEYKEDALKRLRQELKQNS